MNDSYGEIPRVPTGREHYFHSTPGAALRLPLAIIFRACGARRQFNLVSAL
jgi:hypothetical protein